MEYRILGPVDLWRDGRSISIVGQKQRTLLAVLVLKANQVVSHDRLLTALWGTEIPASSRKLLHNHVWSLRRLLRTATHLSGMPTGYRLNVPPGGSDLETFTAGTRAARTSFAAGDHQQAAHQLREALALWRGPALAGTRDELMLTDGAALDELRVAALADRIDADLALDRHADLISELRHLAVEHPLQERLRGQLMTALHRSGRTAEALEEYRIARHHLRQELGLEPGQELSDLHQMILTAAPVGDVVRSAVLQRAPVPRQLPADVARFTGRDEGLRELDLLVLDKPPAVAIAVVTGAPGVGKTALATHWAHQVASEFPDGQLYLDLRGYSPGEPVTNAQALYQLLYGLGVAQDAIPSGPGEREALYRSLLADRRLLVVLDNAAKADQIRPLLPGSSVCRVVVTSRDSLRGLAVTHDVRAVTLDVMSAEEAVALLAEILGRERVAREEAAAGELAQLCGYLPLALRLAAAQLAEQPDMRMVDFVAGFIGQNRLTALEVEGDPSVGVRDAFNSSYRRIAERHRRIFRLMGLHPGPDVGVEEIVAMAGESRREVDSAMRVLAAAHLVHRGDGGRYALHDLVWLYARDCAHAHDDESVRRTALFRLFDWFLQTTKAAMDALYTTTVQVDLVNVSGGYELPAFDDFDAAAAWLDARYRVLMSVIRCAARHGANAHVWQLVEILDYFFYLRNHVDDWLTSLELALRAVRELEDRDGEGRVLNALGAANLMTGRMPECIDFQQQALDLSRAVGDLASEAYALNRIGYSRLWTGEFKQAIADSVRAIDLYRQQDNEQGEISATVTLGIAYHRVGRYTEALHSLNRCLDFDRAHGNRSDEGYTLVLVGDVYDSLQSSATALEFYERAVRLNQEIGQRRFEACAANGIGRVYRKLGRLAESVDRHLYALELVREGCDRISECEVLMDLGHCYLAEGEDQEALTTCRQALDIADSIADRFLQGLARGAVADACRALGRTAEAASLSREALDILEPMGVPQAADIAKHL
ncbi:BTAD domain-containing putative transcriptional regulator [Nonomuraea sp. NPDC059007]|uniref:AfsR/SARP family transcriptional regulator n=1 Tax=Nonomuraea sp. NPDC059007 TaxID=3346692 RepID=UPI00368955D5